MVGPVPPRHRFLDCPWHGRTVQLGGARRDFPPWNTTLVGSRHFVFDWETAVEQAPAFYDLFHRCEA